MGGTRTAHLMTVGSLLGMGLCDAVVWGSGVHCAHNVRCIYEQRRFRKYDVRLLRGSVSGEILKSAGYSVPDVYGDPAVIMPLIYHPMSTEKEHDVSVVLHLGQEHDVYQQNNVNYINVATYDYRHFIDEIVRSRLIISSSLHGIILAETYGVPAVFMKKGMDNELMKFYDWYFSTERYSVVVVNSVSEALDVTPMCLPDLTDMQKNVVNTFPTDLWEESL